MGWGGGDRLCLCLPFISNKIEHFYSCLDIHKPIITSATHYFISNLRTKFVIEQQYYKTDSV